MTDAKKSANDDSARAGRGSGPFQPIHLKMAFLALAVAGAAAIAYYWDEVSNYFDWGVSPSATEDAAASLEARVAAIEQGLAGIKPPDDTLEGRVAALEASLRGASAENAPTAALEARIEVLGKNLAALEERLTGEGRGAPGPAADLVAAVADLAFPLFSSQPFEAELERVRTLSIALPQAAQAGLAPSLTALSRPAPTGIPAMSSLYLSFEAGALEALKEAGLPEGATWWQRTLARFKSLVVVRRVDGAGATPAEAFLRDVEAALAAGRLEDAIALVEALPEGKRAPFEPWLVQARGRAGALAAFRALAGSLR